MSVLAKGNTALITGAASGVGLAVARLCRKHGMKLALVDNNDENLSLARETIGADEQTETYRVDVSRAEQWADLRNKVASDFNSGIDLLLLNAGVAVNGGWDDTEYFHKIFDTNFFGVVNGLNTFLPIIKSQPDSRPSAIVLTGSKQGVSINKTTAIKIFDGYIGRNEMILLQITNPPGNPAYNASKAAIKSLAEHLSYDMRNSNTSVHLLVPGWTFTGLSGGGPRPSQEKPAGAWTPEQVADYMEKKMKERQFWIICPDNDVSESTDRKRMMWTAGDAVLGRPPLSRWREEFQAESKRWMDQQSL